MRLCIKGFRVWVMSQTDPGWRELVSCASRAAVSEGCALPARDITGTSGLSGVFSHCGLLGVMGW